MSARQKRKICSDDLKQLQIVQLYNNPSSLSDRQFSNQPVVSSVSSISSSLSTSSSSSSTSGNTVSILFRLNEDWFKTLVSCWLDLPSIARLDTAFTNKFLRQYWLECVSNIYTLSTWSCVPTDKINDAVYWITSKSKKFNYINFSDCPNITNSCLLRIARECPQLLVLDLKHYSYLADIVVGAIGFGCKQIRVLHIEGPTVTDLGIQAIGEGCFELTEFYFNKCEKITDAGLIQLANGCKKFQSIHFIGGKLFTDDGLLMLTQSCTMLKSISIIKCANLSNNTFLNISNNCPLLEEFTFAGINNGITDCGISSIARGCPCLRTFSFLSTNISNTGEITSEITDIALTDLAKGCNQLQFISLYFCQRISDQSLYGIASHCPLLLGLVLEDISCITFSGISKILNSCRYINSIKIANCNSISLEEMRSLKASHSCVRLFYNEGEVENS